MNDLESALSQATNFAKSFLGGGNAQSSGGQPTPFVSPQNQATPFVDQQSQAQQQNSGSFWDGLVNDWKGFVQRGQQTDPTINTPQGFLSSPGGQALMGVQQATQGLSDFDKNTPLQVNTETPVLGGISRVPLVGGLAEGLADIPGQTMQGAYRTGEDIGKSVTGQNVTPQNYIGDIAQMGQLPLLLATGVVGAEALGGQNLLNSALTGGKLTGAFGVLGGLQQGRNAPDVPTQIGMGLEQGALSVPIGMTAGVGFPLAGKAIGGILEKGLDAIRGKIGEGALQGNILARLTPDYITQKGQDLIQKVVNQANQLKPQFDATMENIAKQVGLDFNDFESRIKNPTTFLQKIANHRLDGEGKYDAQDVNDVYGGRFIANNPAQKQAIIDNLHSTADSGAFKILNEEQVDKDTYHAYHIDISKNGINGEIQIHDPNSLLESVANHEIRAQYGENPPPDAQLAREQNAQVATSTPQNLAQEQAQNMETQKRLVRDAEAVSQPSVQGMQVGITSAQNANPNPQVTALLSQGDSMFKSGDINGALDTLKKVTDLTKDSLSSLLNESGVKVNEMEGNTHGLYFGTPEPSYWLNIAPESENAAVGALAKFAKQNSQDSFFTARQDVSGTPGLTINFGRPLTNEDVVNIEKVANDNGIGLTLNQNKGVGVTFNIKDYDGMNEDKFAQAASNTLDALRATGGNVTGAFDNYKINVYNNSTYDSLISGQAKGAQPEIRPEQPSAKVAGNASGVSPEVATTETPRAGTTPEVSPVANAGTDVGKVITPEQRTKFGLPQLTPTYRGTTMDEWNSIKSGNSFKSPGFNPDTNRTWTHEDPAYSQDYANSKPNGVTIEFKPSARDKMGVESGQPADKSGLLLGKDLNLNDVAKVTDNKGNVVYDASNPNAVQAGVPELISTNDVRAIPNSAFTKQNIGRANLIKREVNPQEKAPFGIESLRPNPEKTPSTQPLTNEGPGPLPFENVGKLNSSEMPLEKEAIARQEKTKTEPAQSIQTDIASVQKASMMGGNNETGKPDQTVVDNILKFIRGRETAPTSGVIAGRSIEDLRSLGLKGILDFQKNVESNPRFAMVREAFDKLFDSEKKAGVGGKEFTYKQNYLPQLWNNSIDEVGAVFGQNRLSQYPSFTRQSLLEDYEKGIKAGLKPRFDNLPDLLNWRTSRSERAIADANFIDYLQKNNLLQPKGKVPNDGSWTEAPQLPNFSVQLPEGGRYSGNYMMPTPLAKIVNNYLGRVDNPLQVVPNIARLGKRIVMTTGIPKTGVNVHLATMLPRFMMGGRPTDIPILQHVINPTIMLGKTLATAVHPGNWLSTDEGISTLREAQAHGFTHRIEDNPILAPLRASAQNQQGRLGTFLGKVNDVQNNLFAEPTFGRFIPTLALKDVYRPTKNAFIKAGMDPEEAMSRAAKYANEVSGNPNITEMFRNKAVQEAANSVIFSPKLLESNYRLGKGIAQAVMDPKNPAGMAYRNFAMNMVGLYGVANIANYLSSGHLMIQNDPGHKFQIELGYTNDGQKRYLNAFGSAIDFAKIPIDMASAAVGMAQGDSEAGQQFWSDLNNKESTIAQLIPRFLTNTNTFGQPLIPAGANPLVGVANLGGQMLPQSLNSAIGFATGNKGLEQAITQGLGLPFRYSGGPTTQKLVMRLQAEGKAPQEIQAQVNQMYQSPKYVSTLPQDAQTLTKGYYAGNATYQTAVTTNTGIKVFPDTVQGAQDARDYAQQNNGKITSLVDQKQGFGTHTAAQMNYLADHFDKLYDALKADPKNLNDPLFNGMPRDQAKNYIQWSTMSGLDKAKFEEQNPGVLDGKRMMNDYEKQTATQRGLNPYPDDPIWKYSNQQIADYHMSENMTTGSQKAEWIANHPNIADIRITRQPYLNQITQMDWDNRPQGQSPAEFMKAHPYSNFAGVDSTGQVVPQYSLLDDPLYKLSAPQRQVAQLYTAYSEGGGALNKSKAKALLAQNEWLKPYWDIRSQYYANLPSGNTDDYGSAGLGIKFTYGNTGTGSFGGGTGVTGSGLTDRYLTERALVMGLRNPFYPQITPSSRKASGAIGALGQRLSQDFTKMQQTAPLRVEKPLNSNIITEGKAISAKIPRVSFQPSRAMAPTLGQLGGKA